MENNNIVTIFEGSLNFANPSCEIKENNFYDGNGELHHNLRIRVNEETEIEFKYKQALFRKSDHEEQHDLLMDFISIPFGNEKKLLNFFEDNGFLFHNPTDKFLLYSYTDLFIVVQRARLLVELIGEAAKAEPSLDILINNTLHLLLAPQFTISVTDEENNCEQTVYTSPAFKLQQYLINSGVLVAFPSEVYEDLEEFKKANSTKLFFEQQDFKDMYIRDISETLPKGALDYETFLYNLTKIYTIASIDTIEGVNLSKHKRRYTASLDIELIKKAAKHVIKTELDHFTGKIKPSYNTEDMIGSWDIPDLISAIYYSIFFQNPKFQIIKKCANHTCYKYFSVLYTNKKKKYCTIECGNTVGQRKLRAKRNAEGDKKGKLGAS
jgi:hypothetical protein